MRNIRRLTEQEMLLPDRPGYMRLTIEGQTYTAPRKGERDIRNNQFQQAVWRLKCDAQETYRLVSDLVKKSADAVHATLRGIADSDTAKRIQPSLQYVKDACHTILCTMEAFSYHETRAPDNEAEEDSAPSIALAP